MVQKNLLFFLLVFLAFLGFGPQLQATMVLTSSCAENVGAGFTCNIYEVDANGDPSDISVIVQTPDPITSGYLVLMDSGNPNSSIDQSNVSLWSDVLVFGSSSVQLFSDGCNIAPGDRSCFPNTSNVINGNTGFILETNPGPTVYLAGLNTYNIYSMDDPPPTHNEVPEPSTGVLIVAGISAAGVWRWKRH